MKNNENIELQYASIEGAKVFLEERREKYEKIAQSIKLIQMEISKMIDEGVADNKRFEEIVLLAMERLNITDLKDEIIMILNLPTPNSEEDYKQNNKKIRQ